MLGRDDQWIFVWGATKPNSYKSTATAYVRPDHICTSISAGSAHNELANLNAHARTNLLHSMSEAAAAAAAAVTVAAAAAAVVATAAAGVSLHQELLNPKAAADLLATFEHSETLIEDDNFQLSLGRFSDAPEGQRAIVKVSCA